MQQGSSTAAPSCPEGSSDFASGQKVDGTRSAWRTTVLRVAPAGVRPHLRRLAGVERGLTESMRQSTQEVLFRRLYSFWERLGVHVTPVTFASTIPTLRSLDEGVFTRRSSLVGMDMREASQIALLDDISTRFRDELTSIEGAAEPPWDFAMSEPSAFPAVDSHMLHCLLRMFRPRRYIEVGSGRSTLIAARAALRNAEEGQPMDVTAVEPYPGGVLQQGFPGLTRLIRQGIEDAASGLVSELRPGDVLFVDSSHHPRIDSDVGYLFLEVLPRLPVGVLVHVHDIFLPAEYPRQWVRENKVFPNEQYLLHAFLLHNTCWEVLWAGHYMHLLQPDALRSAFPTYRPAEHRPGSVWLRRIQ